MVLTFFWGEYRVIHWTKWFTFWNLIVNQRSFMIPFSRTDHLKSILLKLFPHLIFHKYNGKTSQLLFTDKLTKATFANSLKGDSSDSAGTGSACSSMEFNDSEIGSSTTKRQPSRMTGQNSEGQCPDVELTHMAYNATLYIQNEMKYCPGLQSPWPPRVNRLEFICEVHSNQ